jgi:hypothetical protein
VLRFFLPTPTRSLPLPVLISLRELVYSLFVQSYSSFDSQPYGYLCLPPALGGRNNLTAKNAKLKTKAREEISLRSFAASFVTFAVSRFQTSSAEFRKEVQYSISKYMIR